MQWKCGTLPARSRFEQCFPKMFEQCNFLVVLIFPTVATCQGSSHNFLLAPGLQRSKNCIPNPSGHTRQHESDGRATNAIPIRRLRQPPLRPSPPLPAPPSHHAALLLHLHRLLSEPRPKLRRRGAASPPTLEPRGRRRAARPPRRLRQPPPPVPRLPRVRVEPPRRDHLRRLHAVAPRRDIPARMPPHPRRWSRRPRLGFRRRPRVAARRAAADSAGMLSLSFSWCCAVDTTKVLFRIPVRWNLVRFRIN